MKSVGATRQRRDGSVPSHKNPHVWTKGEKGQRDLYEHMLGKGVMVTKDLKKVGGKWVSNKLASLLKKGLITKKNRGMYQAR